MEEVSETSSITFLTPTDQLQTPTALVTQHKKELATKTPKTSRGRQKIEIKEIKVDSKRHVTFTKRRNGMFKKAAELSVLTGAKIAAITFSKRGRIYSFGHVDTLIDKYLRKSPVSLEVHHGEEAAEEEGNPWWERPVEIVPDEDLEEYVAAMSLLRENIGKRIVEMGTTDRTVEIAPTWPVNMTAEIAPTWPVNMTGNTDRTAEIAPTWPVNMMGWKPSIDMQSLDNRTDGFTRSRVGQNG